MNIKLKGSAGTEEPAIAITQHYSQRQAQVISVLCIKFSCGGRKSPIIVTWKSSLCTEKISLWATVLWWHKDLWAWSFRLIWVRVLNVDGPQSVCASDLWFGRLWLPMEAQCCASSCLSTRVLDLWLGKDKFENARQAEGWGSQTRFIGGDVKNENHWPEV